MAGIRIVPIGSICLIGFSVIRPSMRAVGSPRMFAIQACADSCTLMANRNAIIWKTISTYSSFIRLGFDTTMQTAEGHVHSGIQPDRLASGTAGQLPLRQDDLVMANV